MENTKKMRLTYTDGERLCYYVDGQKYTYESNYIKKYRETALNSAKNREWKKKSEQMIDDFYFEEDSGVYAEIHGVSLTEEENKIAYTFTVNQTSGIYYKYLDDETKTEAHVILSNEVDFISYCVNEDGEAVGSIRSGEYSANIAVFDKNNGNYKTLTDGGSLDENPFLDKDGNILYDSYGVGRDAENQFVTYLPAEILKLNSRTMELETLVTDENFSFVKPMQDSDGNLYCIKKPGAERKRENVFLQILTIPIRIIEAIVGFISTFVTIFSGKPMVSDGGSVKGDNSAAKNGKKDRRKIFVNNQIINAEEELKRNQKSEYGGFIPREWVLVKIEPKGDGEYEILQEIAQGVADYCIVEEEGKTKLVYTNGKYVFECFEEEKKWKRNKLFNADCCLKISGIRKSFKNNSPFVEDKFFSHF